MVRQTGNGNNDLYFRFGTNTNYGSNATKMIIRDNGNVHIAGDINVVGQLSKGGGTFKIDHPLDPENKFLYHSFVESPDMMNVYNGNVILDESGRAKIELPSYFEALNKDFRYQLTCLGVFAPVYVAKKISANTFEIAGGKPGQEISWQVTGVRKDAFAEMNRVQVEVDKPEAERGTYLHPDAHAHQGSSPLLSDPSSPLPELRGTSF